MTTTQDPRTVAEYAPLPLEGIECGFASDRKYTVHEGDLVVVQYDDASTHLARVWARVSKDATGNVSGKLAVYMLAPQMHQVYLRYVERRDIVGRVDFDDPLMTWFVLSNDFRRLNAVLMRQMEEYGCFRRDAVNWGVPTETKAGIIRDEYRMLPPISLSGVPSIFLPDTPVRLCELAFEEYLVGCAIEVRQPVQPHVDDYLRRVRLTLTEIEFVRAHAERLDNLQRSDP